MTRFNHFQITKRFVRIDQYRQTHDVHIATHGDTTYDYNTFDYLDSKVNKHLYFLDTYATGCADRQVGTFGKQKKYGKVKVPRIR